MDLRLLQNGTRTITEFDILVGIETGRMFSYKTTNFIKSFKARSLYRILAVVYALSLVPMIIIGFFDWPSVDDFSMALQPHHTFVATGNPFLTIVSAFEKMIYISNNWVGYFFSSFMTCLSPSIWGERCYFLVDIIILAVLTFGVIYFFDALLCKTWGMDKYYSRSVALLSLFVMVHSLENGPTRAEAFYWWSGAVNYTFMFGLLLVWMGMIFRFLFEKKRNRRALFVLICVLGFLLGGSNYMSALVAAIMSILGLVILLLIKMGKFTVQGQLADGDRTLKFMWVPFVLNIAGLLVSAAAPGNRIRGTGIGDISPIRAVLRSYYTVFDDCINGMMRWEVLVAFLVITIICWHMSAGMNHRLEHPFIFTAFSLSVMACCVVPPLFAVGNVGGGRIRAIIWMQFVVMMVMTIFYFACWIRQHRQQDHAWGSMAEDRTQAGSQDTSLPYTSAVVLACSVLVVLFGSLLSVYVNPCYYSCTSAVYDLVTGSARQYYNEKLERLEVLEDDSVSDVVFDPHTVKPELLFQSDVYEDATLWENTIVAAYYNKSSVRLR